MGKLFPRALALIDEISRYGGIKDPFWTLGGGTVLMFRYHHRLSKDIDIFVPDPQYLGFVTPRLSDTAADLTQRFAERIRMNEPAHYQWASAYFNGDFYVVATNSGYRNCVRDPRGAEEHLPADATDEQLGCAVLKAIACSRFVKPENIEEFEQLYSPTRISADYRPGSFRS